MTARSLARAASVAALVLVAAAPATSAPRGDSYVLSSRKAVFDDPGVVAISVPDGTPPITRVLFGDLESPAIGPWTPSIRAQTVAVPPGVAGRRGSVVATLEDGSTKRLGSFAWIDPTARKSITTGSGRGCPAGTISTVSSARSVGRGRYRYTYEVRSEMPGPVTVRWSVLRYLGLEGGLAATVPAGQTYTISRVAPGSPVEIPGTVTSDEMPGCLPDEAGVAWSSPALFPASELPVVAAPADVEATVDSEGVATVTWTYPGTAPAPDDFEITTRAVFPDDPRVGGPAQRGPAVTPFATTKSAGSGGARSTNVYLPLSGAHTISVRAIVGGVPSAPAVTAVVR